MLLIIFMLILVIALHQSYYNKELHIFTINLALYIAITVLLLIQLCFAIVVQVRLQEQILQLVTALVNIMQYHQIQIVQRCDNICNECSGTSTTCTLCQASTQRLSPPACQTCPSNMFIQSGIDACQQCNNYCDQCISNQANCTTCLTSTLRTNPPSCVTCPDQYVLILNVLNCQPCTSYCDQCTLSVSHCTNCKSVTLRTNAPICQTCPSQMFITPGIDNCQSCVSYCNNCTSSATNCTACQLFSLRIQPPLCTTCPAGMYTDNNYTTCQYCANYCTNCNTQSTQCTSCNPLTGRTFPPFCTICPHHQYTLLGISNCTLNATVNTPSCKCQTCADQCSECHNQSNNCISCDIDSKKIDPPLCKNCPIGMYSINGLLNCQKCSDNCISCLEQTGECIQCQSSNYFIQGSQCIQCPVGCLTCDQQKCYTCTQLKIIVNDYCQCQFPCLTCDDIKCLTCVTNDYRIINNGCYYCPQRCATCDTQGNCLTSPQYCQIGIVLRNQVQCTQCISNFYLENEFCIKCSDECLECTNQPYICTKCRFNQFSIQNCQICESQLGFYSNYSNNTCYTICGDGVQTGLEECDDGNNYSNDGCSNCQVDYGYFCSAQICEQIIYPTPMIQEQNPDIYSSLKNISLTYNIPVTATNIDIQIDIIPKVEFTYSLAPVNNQEFQILLHLQEESLNAQLNLSCINPQQIISLQGQYQIKSFILSEISDYLKLSQMEHQIMNTTDTITNILLIILVIMICLAVLFGGLEVFWNLLDLLQTISYLKYINTVKPYFLYEFFNLFGFLQFSNLPLTQLFSIQDLIYNYLDNSCFRQPPNLIYNDGYTTSSIQNIIPIILVFITALGIYSFCYIVLQLIRQWDRNQFLQYKNNLSTLQITLYNIKIYIIIYCDTMCRQWAWSGLLRIGISSAYEISFLIALGVYGLYYKDVYIQQNYQISLQSQHTLNLIQIDSFTTLFVCIVYLTMIYSMSVTLISNYRTLKQNTNKFGAIYESLRLSKYSKYYTIILTLKKFLFMIFLVLFYNESAFQTVNIVLIQVFQLGFLFFIKPIQGKKEMNKQIIWEILMLVAQIQLSIMVIDDYHQFLAYNIRKLCGWVCLFAIVLMIISQLAIDLHQQYKYFYKKYSIVRKLAKRLDCKKPAKVNTFQDLIL